MNLERVLVVVKQTALSKLGRDRRTGTLRMRKLLKENDESVDRIRPAHDEHVASVSMVRRALRSRDIEFVERTEAPHRPISEYDLVISVGGDGMLLSVSHAVRGRTPVLGVNSSPSFSVGFLTGCTAPQLGGVLDRLRTGRLKPFGVQRLQVQVGPKILSEPVLNDVLFCANNPAVMTRYVLIWPDGEETQRSSGVWVSTPAGSSSALRSAGGPALPLSAKQFAFLVREPYAPPGSSVRVPVAVLDARQRLTIECRILEASVFLDGSHKQYSVPFGERVTFSLHPSPLRLVRAHAIDHSGTAH